MISVERTSSSSAVMPRAAHANTTHITADCSVECKGRGWSTHTAEIVARFASAETDAILYLWR